MSSEKNALSVGGYLFYTEKDAQLARAEEQKIEYLEARMDYSSPESIRYIYEHTIQERLFKTPVGLRYLQKLRDFLLAQPETDPGNVMEIPLYITFDGELREHASPARESGSVQKERRGKEWFYIVRHSECTAGGGYSSHVFYFLCKRAAECHQLREGADQQICVLGTGVDAAGAGGTGAGEGIENKSGLALGKAV